MRSGESDAGDLESIDGLLLAEPAQLRRAITFCHWQTLEEPQACLRACWELRLAATGSAHHPLTDYPALGSKAVGLFPSPFRPRRSASRSPAPGRAQARQSRACQWQMCLPLPAGEMRMQSRSTPARCWKYPVREVSCGACSRLFSTLQSSRAFELLRSENCKLEPPAAEQLRYPLLQLLAHL